MSHFIFCSAGATCQRAGSQQRLLPSVWGSAEQSHARPATSSVSRRSSLDNNLGSGSSVPVRLHTGAQGGLQVSGRASLDNDDDLMGALSPLRRGKSESGAALSRMAAQVRVGLAPGSPHSPHSPSGGASLPQCWAETSPTGRAARQPAVWSFQR